MTNSQEASATAEPAYGAAEGILGRLRRVEGQEEMGAELMTALAPLVERR